MAYSANQELRLSRCSCAQISCILEAGAGSHHWSLITSFKCCLIKLNLVLFMADLEKWEKSEMQSRHLKLIQILRIKNSGLRPRSKFYPEAPVIRVD